MQSGSNEESHIYIEKRFGVSTADSSICYLGDALHVISDFFVYNSVFVVAYFLS